MEKIPEDQICQHMLKSYKKVFNAKYKKPKVGYKTGFVETEHYNRIANLNLKVLDIGSISTKSKTFYSPLAHPVYTKRSTTSKFHHSDYFTNLSQKHPKYIPTYFTFLK